MASPLLSDGSAVYTHGLGLTSERRNDATGVYHLDGLGSTRFLTNSNQAIANAWSFDAFGNTLSGTASTPFRYAGSWGYNTDADNGLMLLGHRYYDPGLGRFLTPDPIKDGDNWYGYVENNPLGNVDPTGEIHLVISIDKSTGKGTWKIYVDGDDIVIGPGPWGMPQITIPPSGTLIGSGPASNKVPHPDENPNKVGGGGRFPPGNWPYRYFKPKNDISYGPGQLRFGDPGDPPWERNTWVHGGRRNWAYRTLGCIRIDDSSLLKLALLFRLNGGELTVSFR